MLTRFAFVIASALIASPALAADEEFVYSQSTGSLTLGGKVVGHGYSGHGAGKDDPSRED